MLYPIRTNLIFVLALASWFLVPTAPVFAQKTIEGKVVNARGQAISGANITVQSGLQILDYAISDEEGEFRLQLAIPADTLMLQASHLAYDTWSTTLDAEQAYYRIEMQVRTHALPEVSVKVPAVQISGDTLTFAVEAFVQEGDENIEVVLSRIPGVIIEPSGAISYQGHRINKFYIEGLDLLEGKYTQATRNLGPEHIRDIQILQRHQPVRALDSIYRPPNAAVNLRLKSGIALTGSYEGELSSLPGGMLAARMFGFSKRKQFNVSSSWNNLGRQIADQFVDHYKLGLAVTPDLVRLQPPHLPAETQNQRIVLNNRESTGSINYLQALGKHTQLKVQGQYTDDRQDQAGSNLRNYFFADQQATFTEQVDYSYLPAAFEVRPIIEYNAPKTYARLNSQWLLEQNRSLTDNIINSASTQEMLTGKRFLLSNQLEVLTRHKTKKRAQAIHLDLDYEERDYQLEVMNAFINIPGQQSLNLLELEQPAHTRKLDLDLHTAFFMKKQALSGRIRTSGKITNQSITSATKSDGSLLDPLFQNNHSTQHQSLQLDQEWDYEIGRFRFGFDMPVALQQISVHDRREDISQKNTFLNYRPSLGISWHIGREDYLSLSSAYFHDVYTFGDLFFDRYLVESSRQVRSQSVTPNAYDGYQITLTANGHNPSTRTYYLASLSYQSETAAQVRSNTFDQTGTLWSYLNQENQSNLLRLDGYLQATPWSVGALEVSGNYQFRNADQFINGNLTRVRTHQISVEPELSFTYGKQVTTLAALWNSNWVEDPDIQNSLMRLHLAHYWQITSRSALEVNHRSYLFGLADRVDWSHLLNISWRYKITAWRAVAHIHLRNVFNARQLTSLLQTNFLEAFSTFQLQPRQVQVHFKKSF